MGLRNIFKSKKSKEAHVAKSEDSNLSTAPPEKDEKVPSIKYTSSTSEILSRRPRGPRQRGKPSKEFIKNQLSGSGDKFGNERVTLASAQSLFNSSPIAPSIPVKKMYSTSAVQDSTLIQALEKKEQLELLKSCDAILTASNTMECGTLNVSKKGDLETGDTISDTKVECPQLNSDILKQTSHDANTKEDEEPKQTSKMDGEPHLAPEYESVAFASKSTPEIYMKSHNLAKEESTISGRVSSSSVNNKQETSNVTTERHISVGNSEELSVTYGGELITPEKSSIKETAASHDNINQTKNNSSINVMSGGPRSEKEPKNCQPQVVKSMSCVYNHKKSNLNQNSDVIQKQSNMAKLSFDAGTTASNLDILVPQHTSTRKSEPNPNASKNFELPHQPSKRISLQSKGKLTSNPENLTESHLQPVEVVKSISSQKLSHNPSSASKQSPMKNRVESELSLQARARECSQNNHK